MRKFLKIRGGKKLLTAMVLASLLTGVAASAATLPSVTYDDDTKTKISLGENGNTVGISGVTGGQVYIGSTFVATGNDVYEVDKKISRFQSRLDTVDLTTSTINATLSSHTLDINTLKNNTATLKERVDRGYVFTINGWQAKEATPSDNEVNFKTGDNISITNDNGSLKFSVLADGKVASGNGGLVSGDTVYRAISDITSTSTLNGVAYDDDTYTKLTLKGENGTKLTGLADGYIGPDSPDAVNGGQIYDYQKTVDARFKSVNGCLDEQTNFNTQMTEITAGLSARTRAVEDKAGTTYNFLKEFGFQIYANGKPVTLLNMDNSNFNVTSDGSVKIEAADTSRGKGLKVSAVANGKIESGNTGLVSGDTVYQAIRGISGGSTKNALTYDDDTHTSITFHGMTDEGIGATIKNVLNGDIAKGSKDAVNGGQVWDLQTKVESYDALIAGNQININKAQSQISNNMGHILDLQNDIDIINDKFSTGIQMNVNGRGVSKINTDNPTMNFVNSDTINVKYENKALKFEANTGKVETGNTGLVTGGMVKEAIAQATEGIATDVNVANKADKDLSNLSTAGSDKISTIATEAAKAEVAGKADIDAGNIDVAIWQNKLDTVKTDGSNINLSAWQSRLGNGINAEGNTGLITGDTLYKALANVKGTTYTGSDTIAIGDDNSISVKANGKVETGNTGLVTGGQVKEAIAKATENMATDATIQGKADTKLSNITEEGKQVIKDTVKDDLAKKADQSYVDNQVKGINDTLANKADISYVDTKVSDAVKDKVTQDELKAGLDKKADADLSNISKAGKQVIKDTMKDDLDKKADKTYVDSQVKDINDKLSGKADTSYVDAALKDKVSKDELAASVANKADKTYVDDQVSNAVKDKVTKTELSDGLATKADKIELETKAATDASNLTDENVKAWSGKLGIGMVQENDTGLVTGDAVYKAISQVDVNNGMISSDDKTIQVGKNSEAASVDFTNAKGEQRVLTGIKTDASDASSAANVGYVQANVEGVYQNVNTAMDRMYNKLDKNMNKGVAGASALAALKPMDFDPDDRLSFAVGYGHYKGANAAALGAFYRPSENTMINAGVSLGNGSNAVNAGVAFKVGKGSAYAGLSKAEMAAALVDQGKKIDSLEKDNAELRQKLEEILAKLK